jgi:hypothetical protein
VKNDNSVWQNARTQHDAIYINASTWSADGSIADYTFSDEGPAWGADDPGMSRGVVLADLDRDGWLDIGKRILNNGDSITNSENAVYLSHCGTEGWLEVALEQPETANTRAIGAKVAVEAGGRTYRRWVNGGGTGYASQPPADLHFGLGDADVVDQITVTWPDGAVSRLLDVDARQRVTITR